MSENTKIEWCDHSWSPWRGCTKVSAGCANCYAETLSKRNPLVLGQWGKGKPRVLAKNWPDPVKWNRREIPSCMCDVAPPERCGCYPSPTVFPSLCDWLDAEVPIEWLARFLKLIHDTPNLTWLLLTKRPENWRPRLEAVWKADHHHDWPGEEHEGSHTHWLRLWLHNQSQMQPPSNVWIGTSVEDQANADRRIPELLKIPAVGRFLSLEPLLGPVDIRLVPDLMKSFNSSPHGWHNWLRQRIQWAIIGGESGHGARPCNVEWIRSLVAQGKAAGVATFVKQLGARCYSEDLTHSNDCTDDHCALAGGIDDCEGEYVVNFAGLTHSKGGDPAEWPDDLRVREFPEGLR